MHKRLPCVTDIVPIVMFSMPKFIYSTDIWDNYHFVTTQLIRAVFIFRLDTVYIIIGEWVLAVSELYQSCNELRQFDERWHHLQIPPSKEITSSDLQIRMEIFV